MRGGLGGFKFGGAKNRHEELLCRIVLALFINRHCDQLEKCRRGYLFSIDTKTPCGHHSKVQYQDFERAKIVSASSPISYGVTKSPFIKFRPDEDGVRHYLSLKRSRTVGCIAPVHLSSKFNSSSIALSIFGRT